MATWQDVTADAPGFAAAVRAFFDAHVHKTLATLRRDGAPRISGIEVSFAEGDLWFGGMWESRKALDLRRDARFALHSGSDDPPGWKGDAKLSGRAAELTDPARKTAILRAAGTEAPVEPFHLFRAEIAEVALVRLGEPADHLVIEAWSPERGLRRQRR